jgi:hypothetical protein
MQTIKTKNINGYDIIIGVGDAGGFIDPEATKKIVNEKIKKTDVFKNIGKIKKQMELYAGQALQAKENCKAAKTKADQTKFFEECKFRKKQIVELQEQELYPLAKELDKKYEEMLTQNAIYFNLPPTDFFISDEEAEIIKNLMIEATQEGAVVTKEKEKIVDNRGKIFWKKDEEWEKTNIDVLGVEKPVDSIEEKNLTEEQKKEIVEQLETERIENLSTVEKEKEKDLRIQGAIVRAGQMKNELEIQGDNKALEKAQSWLAEETEKINLIYS